MHLGKGGQMRIHGARPDMQDVKRGVADDALVHHPVGIDVIVPAGHTHAAIRARVQHRYGEEVHCMRHLRQVLASFLAEKEHEVVQFKRWEEALLADPTLDDGDCRQAKSHCSGNSVRAVANEVLWRVVGRNIRCIWLLADGDRVASAADKANSPQ